MNAKRINYANDLALNKRVDNLPSLSYSVVRQHKCEIQIFTLCFLMYFHHIIARSIYYKTANKY